MTIFELLFSLTSVILGLALTQIATNLHSLIMAGRRVRWAPEPILMTIIILLVIVFVWLDQWGERHQTAISYPYALLSVLKLMTLYLGAAFVLTNAEPGTEKIDLYAYYDRTRLFTFGSLISSMLLFGLYRYNPDIGWSWSEAIESLVLPFMYAPLIFIRRRWFNVLWLTLVLLVFGSSLVNFQVSN